MPESQQHTHSDRAIAQSDEALLEQFLLGHDTAYVELYGRYDAQVLTYLRTILRDHPAAADDLFQETFIRLFRERKRRKESERTGNYRPVKRVKGWIFRVAHNLAISYLRRLRQHVSISDREEESGRWDERLMVPIEESFARIYGDDDPMEGEEIFEQLRACIELLPLSLREVYVLREIEGLEYEEVASIAGCTPEAARMRLSRARRALRKALEKYLENRQ